jgi:hypothetical protein
LRDLTPAERVAMGERGRAHVVARHRREDASRVLSAVLCEVARGQGARA